MSPASNIRDKNPGKKAKADAPPRRRSPQTTQAEPTPATPGNLSHSLGYAIRRAQLYAFQEFASFMREFDIRPAQYALLILIAENPALAQSDAAATLSIEKANLTGLLLELEQRTLVERKGSPIDRRAYSLHLTAAGKKLVRKLMRRHDEYEAALTSKVGEQGKTLLLTLLTKLVQP